MRLYFVVKTRCTVTDRPSLRDKIIFHKPLDISFIIGVNYPEKRQQSGNDSFKQSRECLKVIAPNGTSQECSSCGHKVKKPLPQRVHNCPKCKVILCRDLNASINIKNRHTVLKLSQCPHRGVASPHSPEGECVEYVTASQGRKNDSLVDMLLLIICYSGGM